MPSKRAIASALVAALSGPHTHRHERVEHSHAHYPDMHHRHEH